MIKLYITLYFTIIRLYSSTWLNGLDKGYCYDLLIVWKIIIYYITDLYMKIYRRITESFCCFLFSFNYRWFLVHWLIIYFEHMGTNILSVCNMLYNNDNLMLPPSPNCMKTVSLNIYLNFWIFGHCSSLAPNPLHNLTPHTDTQKLFLVVLTTCISLVEKILKFGWQ